MSHRDAQRTKNVIKQVIEQETSSGAGISQSYGVISGFAWHHASAYLNGNYEGEVTDIRVPSGMGLSVGDFVRVAEDARGHSWVDEVLPKDEYPKLAFDSNAKKLYLGDGVTPPSGGATGQVPVQQADGTVAWGGAGGGAGVSEHALLNGLAADDHTQYQKTSQKNIASGYAGLDANSRVGPQYLGSGVRDTTRFLRDDGSWQVVAGGSGGGVTDHGALTGLADDDHPRYNHPDIDTHITIGLATTGELSAHTALAHTETHPTKNTGPADANKWAKMATGSFTARFQETSGTVFIGGNGSFLNRWTRGIYRFRVHQEDAMGSQPLVISELTNAADIAPGNIRIVTIVTSTQTQYEIWVRVTNTYEWTELTPLWVKTDAIHNWYDCPTWATAPSAGTTYNTKQRTRLPTKAGTPTDADMPGGVGNDGDTCLDTTLNLLHVRSGGEWYSIGDITTHAAAADPHTGYQKESERASASGYASLDSNTRVPSSQLGTGTASSSTFLRGDRTWASAGLATFKQLSSNFDSTATGLATVTGLDFAVASGNWNFLFEGTWESIATTTGINLSVLLPAGTVARWIIETYGVTSATVASVKSATTSDGTTTEVATLTADTPYNFRLFGQIQATASGTIALRLASEVSGSRVRVHAGSIGRLV